ncbi:MAG: hypothetical protein LRS49_01550 [Desulfurococcales archaeon]|nr:hypothetical protein [Desulfurococcales archaeon]
MLSERGYLALALLVMLLATAASLGAVAYLAGGGRLGSAYVSSYHAVLQGLDLLEDYTFHLGSGKHMIYRQWGTPLYLEGSAPSGVGPYVGLESITCPPGAVGYVYDAGRQLHLLGPASDQGGATSSTGSA